MARQRKLSPERKAFINSLIEYYHPEDAADVQEILKDLLGDTLLGMLEAEMDEKLGYSKYDYPGYIGTPCFCLRSGCISGDDLPHDRPHPACCKRMAEPTFGKEICHRLYGCRALSCKAG